jgi:hypothetical protein
MMWPLALFLTLLSCILHGELLMELGWWGGAHLSITASVFKLDAISLLVQKGNVVSLHFSITRKQA